jgi:hypothetical protein
VPPLPVTRSSADRLGKRLANGEAGDEDYDRLELILAAYQAALDSAQRILEGAGLLPTSRVKSTGTLIDKLQRGSSMKSIQDIAGMRIVVTGGRRAQDRVVRLVVGAFSRDGQPKPRTIDRRKTPTHGYRAVHVIVTHDDLPIEVQVRTELQDAWAQLIERIGDAWGRGLRYGSTVAQPSRPLAVGVSMTRSDFVQGAMQLGESINLLELNEEVVDWFQDPGRALMMTEPGSEELRRALASASRDIPGLRNQALGHLQVLDELLKRLEEQ